MKATKQPGRRDNEETMSEYYDRQGNPITERQWSDLWHDRAGAETNSQRYDTDSYRRVGYTSSDGIGVSTVWLGSNHGYGGGPPMIFETLVFGGQYDNEGERYSTEKDAIEGHERWVQKAITERGC